MVTVALANPETAAPPAGVPPAGTTAGTTAGVPPATFRAAMRNIAASVVVITVADAAGPAGFTASSLTSVSLDPPLVSFCVDRGSGSARAVREAPVFAVNVLGEEQSAVADRFARPGDRFAAPTRWECHRLGPPLLLDAAAHLVCAQHMVVPLGDHWLIAGLVVDTRSGDGATPLLYHDRRYGGFRASA
jgi:flavin reductase (DIM6/NTAB) family NADH-FMN oxidoreductase RutF